MEPSVNLRKPWMVAVWPGIGHVAINAGYFLMSNLEMAVLAELQVSDLFEVDHVVIDKGILHTGRRPRSRFFYWSNPSQEHDLVIFLGEAQPQLGKHQYCQSIIEFAMRIGVERIYTFAAMATQMHPQHDSRVFFAATNEESLKEIQNQPVQILEEGQISGLNGLLLGVAAEKGLQGGCLLGEMPHVFSQLPFPKASLAVLEVFTSLMGIEVDLTELAGQASQMDDQLGALLSQVEEQLGHPITSSEVEKPVEATAMEKLTPEDHARLDKLFDEAGGDRKKAFELKQELDRLKVFKEFEDRFLDLFKNSN